MTDPISWDLAERIAVRVAGREPFADSYHYASLEPDFAEFTGVPWMRAHFLSLVDQSLSAVDPDPKRFLDALRRSVEQMRAGQNPLDEGGLVALIAGPEQQAVLRQIQGMMSLLEGHGDITMNRAGAGLIPSAGRFQRVLHERRNAGGPARIIQRLLGIEAKLQQYELGERFIDAVEAEGGQPLFDLVWASPENLPTLAEIREPKTWMSRVRAEAAAAQ